jgi:hypothetical protein
MNRKTPLILGALIFSAAGCKKKEPAAGARAATATATASAQSAPAAALNDGAIAGPYASIEAYCTDVSAKFVKDECWSPADQIEMCSCDAADQDDLTGNVKAGGKGANLLGAHLVVVADAATDYAYCSLALQLANGVHVVHKAFPCGAAPVSHDGGISLTVNVFNIADDKLTLAYTSDDGEAKKQYSVECTASAADQVACGGPAAK